MGIFKRIKDIFAAKAETAVSAAEAKDPVALIKLEINRSKDSIMKFEKEVVKVGGATKVLEKQYNVALTDAQSWNRKAELAVNEGNDSLAEQAIMRAEQAEATANELKPSLDKMKAQFNTLKGKIVDKKKAIDQYDRQLVTLSARQSAANASKSMRKSMSGFDDSGFDRIDALSKHVDDMECELESADEMEAESNGTDLDAQFSELEAKSSVSDKLAALKAKKAKSEEKIAN